MDGATDIHFDCNTPVDDEGLRANVRHALSLGLPELRDFEYPWQTDMHVVANGPSARVPHPGQHSVAVNGAIRLWEGGTHHPRYWIGCDPQAKLADLLGPMPYGTTYLVASKCHPDVFAALRDRKVILWHVEEPATADMLVDKIRVSSGVSVTTTSFGVMAYLGLLVR